MGRGRVSTRAPAWIPGRFAGTIVCLLRRSALVASAPVARAWAGVGTGSSWLSVPNHPSLQGVSLVVQELDLDPEVPQGVSMSGGLTMSLRSGISGA